MATDAAPSMAGTNRKPETQDILFDGKNCYHPFPTLKPASAVWKAFRLDSDLDYQESNQLFCMKCIKISPEDKSMLHSEKWKQVGTTQQMILHMKKFHPELLPNQPDRKSAKNNVTSSLQRDMVCVKVSLTKKMTSLTYTQVVSNLSQTKNNHKSGSEVLRTQNHKEGIQCTWLSTGDLAQHWSFQCSALKTGGQALTRAQLRLVGSQLNCC